MKIVLAYTLLILGVSVCLCSGDEAAQMPKNKRRSSVVDISESQSIAGSGGKNMTGSNPSSKDQGKSQAQQLQKADVKTKDNRLLNIKQGQQGQAQVGPMGRAGGPVNTHSAGELAQSQSVRDTSITETKKKK